MADNYLKDLDIIVNDPSKPGGIKSFNFNNTQATNVTNIRLNNPGSRSKITTETVNQLIEFLNNSGINIGAPDGKAITLSYNGVVVQTFNASGLDIKGKITNLTEGTAEKDAANFGQLNKLAIQLAVAEKDVEDLKAEEDAKIESLTALPNQNVFINELKVG